MVEETPRLTVVITPAATEDLASIWDYNADRYGVPHADGYRARLREISATLEMDSRRGKKVFSRPEYRYLTVRKGRGHGHVIVYHILGDEVEVVRFFHTARNWQDEIANF